jgi:hypothetical protein
LIVRRCFSLFSASVPAVRLFVKPTQLAAPAKAAIPLIHERQIESLGPTLQLFRDRAVDDSEPPLQVFPLLAMIGA